VTTSEVKLIRWPADAAEREVCKNLGTLRLLIVEARAPAPVCPDIHEDWVRTPISRDDLQARMASLRARVAANALPELDPGGILRYRGRRITLSPTETDLLSSLIRNFGAPVSRKELFDCLPDRVGKSKRNALDLHIMRLRRRLDPVGLTIQTLWSRGYLLENR
jgi:DNA-binding response OmpR family regulator